MFNLADQTEILAFTPLLPFCALLVVIQGNPYQALVMRGILGAVAALIYVLLGAADVALTEALVGTMLSVTLFAVAVRSSLVLRLGVIAPPGGDDSKKLIAPADEQAITQAIAPYHLRLEILTYEDLASLTEAWQTRAIHCWYEADVAILNTPVVRLQEILAPALAPQAIAVKFVPASTSPVPPLYSQEIAP
jgi:putative multicomponent Na+:H+ antiporter subunit B